MIRYGCQTRRRWLKMSAGIAGACVLAGCSGSDDSNKNVSNETSNKKNGRLTNKDWPMYGFNLQNTAYQPAITGPTNDEVTERTVFSTKSGSIYSVAIVDGTLFYSSSSKLFALDIESEQINWERSLSGQPTVYGGTVFGPLKDETLYGYDTENGNRWKSEQNNIAKSFVSHAVPTENGIYLASDETIWRVDYNSGTYSAIVDTPVDARGTTNWPAFHDEILYIGRSTGLYAVNVSTSEIKWTFEPNDGGSVVDCNPSVGDNMVYITSADNQLHAIEIDSGDEIWTVDTKRYVETSPAIANGIVYLAGPEQVIAVDSDSGTIEWEQGKDIILDPHDIVVTDSVCYVTTSFSIRAYDATSGDLIWKYKRPDGSDINFTASPTPYNETLYIPSNDNTLYAVEDQM